MAMEHTRGGPVLLREESPEEKQARLMAKERSLLLTRASHPEDWLIVCPRCSGPLSLQDDGTERCACGWRTGEPWHVEVMRSKSRAHRIATTSACTFMAMLACLAFGITDATGWSVATLVLMSVFANLASIGVTWAANSERELQRDAKRVEEQYRRVIKDTGAVVAKANIAEESARAQ